MSEGTEGTGDWPGEPAERVRAIVEEVLEELDLEGEVEIREDDDRVDADVAGEDDYGLLIGKRGQTIDALQLLCYQAAFRGMRERKRVVLDAAGYRERRREFLIARADRAAERAPDTNHTTATAGKDRGPGGRGSPKKPAKARPAVEPSGKGDEPPRWVVVAPLVAE